LELVAREPGRGPQYRVDSEPRRQALGRTSLPPSHAHGLQPSHQGVSTQTLIWAAPGRPGPRPATNPSVEAHLEPRPPRREGYGPGPTMATQPASAGAIQKDPAKRTARHGPVITKDSDHNDAERTSGVGPRPGPGRRPGPQQTPMLQGTGARPTARPVPERSSRPRDLPLPSSCRGPALHSLSHGARTPAGGRRPPIRAADRDSGPSRIWTESGT
jgi:hypothetical protein